MKETHTVKHSNIRCSSYKFTIITMAVDIDECTESSPCDHNCMNTVGSYTCSCRTGYSLMGKTTCVGMYVNTTISIGYHPPPSCTALITQGIYNRPGIKCKNGRLEIASQIIYRFYFVDQIFAQFSLLDESCIYSAHVGT